MRTLPASTITISETLPAETAVITVTDGETCASMDPSTVYQTADASTVIITETPAPETVTEFQQQTIYVTTGKSYTYTGRTIQPSTIISTVTVTPAPQTVFQSASTSYITVNGPTAYISQPCSNSPIYV